MGERESLAAAIKDKELVQYFYLDQTAEQVIDRMDSLKVELTESQDDVPFNAAVKSYLGGRDSDGHPWILKPAVSPEEILYHRMCAMVYLMDHETGTLAAPTTVFRIGGKVFRATKVVRNSVQISSYDYMRAPFIDILRADLVNRWIYCDEDRNPNNYLVINNSANRPFVVAIDYDKADLLAEGMKITGNPEKFGWFRLEKTRFLTLLRPENFEGVSLETFEPRLAAMTAIPETRITAWARRLAEGYTPDPAALAEKITGNLVHRRQYVDKYFRSMFKPASQTKDVCHDDDYLMFGESFLAMHNKKK